MVWITATQDPGASFGNTGEFFWSVPTSSTEFTSVTIPSVANTVNSKISAVNYANRFYAVGGWTDNMVFTEEFALWIQGIQPPTVVPALAAAAGSTTTIGYLTFARYNANDVLEERSSLSSPSATLTSVNASRTWSSLPTSNNPRVTHLEFWVSVDGATPRMSVRRQIGVTTVTEAVATASLGEAFGDEFERFPRGKFNAIYHDRQVIAGDDRHPDTLYFSGLFTPERYEGLNLKTRNGEPIVGLVTVRDMLLVLCPRSSYVVQGYTEDDITMQISEPNVGAISHHAIAVADGRAFIFSDRGPYIFDGMWHFIGKGVAKKFRSEYETFRASYEDAFAVEDKTENIVKFGPVIHSDLGSYVYWICDYRPVLPETGGDYAQPNWSYDVRSRKDDCAAELSLPGARRGDLYTGSCDGFIRKENDLTNGDDDGDAYGKEMSLLTGHILFNDPGGGRNHGKKLVDLNIYVRSEDTAWGFGVYGGDEYAYPAVSSQFGYTPLETPSAPTVTPQGVAGATTYGYQIVARKDSQSGTEASTEGTTSTGNAVLSASNFNRVTWTAISGAATYDVYRTTGFFAPRKIASENAATIFDDTGIVGTAVAVPSSNTTGMGASFLNASNYDYQPKTVHHFRPTKCVGRGFQFLVFGVKPKNMLFTGLGGTWKKGRAVRQRAQFVGE